MEFLLAGALVVLAFQHWYSQRTLRGELDAARKERAMLLQRIQDPAQASVDHSLGVAQPVSFIPDGSDEEVNELLKGSVGR